MTVYTTAKMSFYTIKDPTERDKTIREYLALKKRIQKREMDERLGDMGREKELRETYKPLIESNEKTTSVIKKSIEPLEEQIENMNKNIESGNVMKNVTSDQDQYFGLVHTKSGMVMGVKDAKFPDEETMQIDHTEYKLTKGLWSLITEKNPLVYTKKDYDTYKGLVHQTDVINHPSNTTKRSRPRNTLKYRNLLSKMVVENESATGDGVNFLPTDINSLEKKLQVLVGEFLAGNKTTRNQIVAILDNLRER